MKNIRNKINCRLRILPNRNKNIMQTIKAIKKKNKIYTVSKHKMNSYTKNMIDV